jgi:hypothetical protein
MVGMVMRVHEVRHLVADPLGGSDFVHRSPQVVPDRRRRVEEHNAFSCRQERRLVGAVCDPEQVPFNSPDVITLLVQGRAQ